MEIDNFIPASVNRIRNCSHMEKLNYFVLNVFFVLLFSFFLHSMFTDDDVKTYDFEWYSCKFFWYKCFRYKCLVGYLQFILTFIFVLSFVFVPSGRMSSVFFVWSDKFWFWQNIFQCLTVILRPACAGVCICNCTHQMENTEWHCSSHSSLQLNTCTQGFFSHHGNCLSYLSHFLVYILLVRITRNLLLLFIFKM